MSELKFNYSASEFEKIPCNLCGKENFSVISDTTANGRRANTCMCKNCGLIFINPRMTKTAYGDYYKYFYREDRDISGGASDYGGDAVKNFEGARKFGKELADHLGSFIGKGLIADVGSSTGGLLFGVKEKLPYIEAVGIEPSSDEAAFAKSKGINTLVGLFENFVSDPAYSFSGASAIICVRSLNNLLDPKSFFDWSYKNLKNGGHLILSVKNFMEQARRAGQVESGVQIDHPFMFTPEVLKKFVESAGFKIVHLGTDWQKGHHIILIGEKNNAAKSVMRAGTSKFQYLRQYLPFWPPFLRTYYLIFYSHRTSFLRKIFKGN